jgi:hypothetical protein
MKELKKLLLSLQPLVVVVVAAAVVVVVVVEVNSKSE